MFETVERIDDSAELKALGERFAERILAMTAYYGMLYPRLKPVVFASADVMSALLAYSPPERRRDPRKRMTIFGYDLEYVYGTEKLYVGFKI